MLQDTIVKHLEEEANFRIEPAFPTSSLTSTLVAGSSTSSANSTDKAKEEPGPSSKPDTGRGKLAESLEGETFLGAVKGTWEDHKNCMKKFQAVLKYMVSLLIFCFQAEATFRTRHTPNRKG